MAWRILHDIYTSTSTDGWLHFSRQRFQIPNRLKEDGKRPIGWSDLFTVETLREGTGWAKVSDGAHTIYQDVILDAEGTEVFESSSVVFTISGTSGGSGFEGIGGGPANQSGLIDVSGRTDLQSVPERTEALSISDSKRETCEQARTDASNKYKADAIADDYDDWTEFINAFFATLKEINFGFMKLQPNALAGSVDRGIEKVAFVVGQNAFEACMEGEPEIVSPTVVWVPPLYLLAETGSQDLEVTLPEINMVGGERRCESGSYERQTMIDGQICTETVEVDCSGNAEACECTEKVTVEVCY